MKGGFFLFLSQILLAFLLPKFMLFSLTKKPGGKKLGDGL